MRPEWADVAERLTTTISATLDGLAVSVEHIGSTAVPEMLAKPVLDIALGVEISTALADVQAPLESAGWVYRGDARDEGGHVFVLDSRPGERVAHLHLVTHNGEQWNRYLAFRDLLRSDADARLDYENAKVALASQVVGDNARREYTVGKTAIVHALLRQTSMRDG